MAQKKLIHKRYDSNYTAKPKEHFEGHWQEGKKYSLYLVVENNWILFVATTGKKNPEPYVVYNPEKGFFANDGWTYNSTDVKTYGE